MMETAQMRSRNHSRALSRLPLKRAAIRRVLTKRIANLALMVVVRRNSVPHRISNLALRDAARYEKLRARF